MNICMRLCANSNGMDLIKKWKYILDFRYNWNYNN